MCDRKKNGKILRTSVQTFFRIELKQNYSREVTEDKGGSSYFGSHIFPAPAIKLLRVRF